MGWWRMLLLTMVGAGAVGAAVASPAPLGSVQAEIPLGRGPCCVVVVGGSVWVGVHRSGTIEQIDARTNKIVWTMHVPPQAIDYGSLVSAYGSLWIVGSEGRVDGVSRLDPRTHALVRVQGIAHANALVALGGRLWASTDAGPFIYEINPAEAKLERRLTVKGRSSYTLGAAADGALWCAVVNSGFTSSGQGNSISTRIDPHSGKVTAKLTPFGSGGYATLAQVASIAAADGSIWETQSSDSAGPGIPWTLVQLDPFTAKVTKRLKPPIRGASDAFPYVSTDGDGTLWLQTGPASIEQINPSTGKPVRTILIPLHPGRAATDYWNSSIVHGFGSYWITVWPGQGGPSDPATGTLLRVAAPS